MTKNELNGLYFEWMCQLVCDEQHFRQFSYRRLLHHLHNMDFSYTLAMDSNREADGTDLRYRFGYENSYEGAMIAIYLDTCPCSVLEMMIALAIRCEEHIMDDPDIGNRTGQWFWGMIENLGLKEMTDARFDKKYTEDIIQRFLDRKYKRNGEGGLFTVKHCQQDLRTIEIWYQMCWYLNEIA